MNCEEILIKSGFSKRKAREHAASLKEVLEQEKQKSKDITEINDTYSKEE